jgi:hypothetical protein
VSSCHGTQYFLQNCSRRFLCSYIKSFKIPVGKFLITHAIHSSRIPKSVQWLCYELDNPGLLWLQGSTQPPSNAKVKNEQNYTSTPPICHQGACRDNLLSHIIHPLASKCVNFLFNYGFENCQHLLQNLGAKSFLMNNPSVSQYFHNAETNVRLVQSVMCSAAGLLNLLCGAGNFGKIWPACGQHEIQYTKWRMNKYTYNYMYNFTHVFLYTSRAIKI